MPFINDAWGSHQYERNIQMGFNIGGPSLVDIRLVLTKDMMENVDDSVMPPKYFALCNDNNQIYYYDKSLNKVIGDSTEVAIGKFRRANILLSDIQDQYCNSLLNDNHIAKIFVAKKLSELINDSDSEGHIIVTDSNFKNYLDQFSTSEEGIFSHVARTGSYNDLLDLPFIPDDAVYVDYHDPNGVFDELNGGTGNQDITVKQALDAISKSFKEDDVLPLYVETGTGDIGDTAHNVRIRADKREQDDKPEIVIKLNLKDLYNDADYITKAYVDSENHRQDLEISKKQYRIVPDSNSRVRVENSSSEGIARLYTDFERVAYTGDYDDVQNKPTIHTDTTFFQLDTGVHELGDWLKDVDIRNVSTEYVRLKDEVDSEGGIQNRLTHIENVDLPSKQDNLIAGDNITLNGVTISAKDTLYTAGYNVALTNDSAGELTIINANDSRYIAGDNVTIANAWEDSEGKVYSITAKDSHYEGGYAAEVVDLGNDLHQINVLYDNESIVLDSNGRLRANTAGQVAAKLPILTQMLSDSESILTLHFDSESLIYDTNKGLKVNIDDETLKYDNNKVRVPIDGTTLVYDNASGKVKSGLTALDNSISIANNPNTIKVNIKPKTGNTEDGFGPIYVDGQGLYVPIDGTSIHKDGSGQLVARGKVNIKSGTGITAIGSEDSYTLNVNIDGKTIKSEQYDNTYRLVGGYTGEKGITIDSNTGKIWHTNNIVAATNVGGVVTETGSTGVINIPVISYDSQGHINATHIDKIYPPLQPGGKDQYFSSNGGKPEWRSFDSEAVRDSKKGITSGAVFDELQFKQDVLTAGTHIAINDNVISSKLNAPSSSSVSIDNDVLDVKIDASTIIRDAAGKLSAVSNLPIRHTLTVSSSSWEQMFDSLGRTYYRSIIANFNAETGVPGEDTSVDTLVSNKMLPFITLSQTASPSTAIETHIQWSRVYHVDIFKDTADNDKKKFEFYSYEKPTLNLKLDCTLFIIE